ncbi:hypothetical protein FHL15_000502 [Xylaria flabelliformis]|uniref:SRR1-like domain-containing protein n=1 Tax=Xylaria flabelliformis TaxID=2512241 RepID=A0A553IDZ2_9PEZI|nr:hypothetical protein FHL15_000502 [Xylaria flabelliformis]
MSGHAFGGGLSEICEPFLQYGCSRWRQSSQCAAGLYDSGVKLWRKEELKNIEEQLAQSCTLRMFTVRSFNGHGDGKAKVTKVVCFGLGDMNPRPSASWIAENASKPEDEQLPETYMVESSFMHHAIAWTIADIARACASTGNTVRLLTQDPNYSAERKETLQKVGWEVVREHGAGGFAELDDESIVFSPFTSAPVKQIIADLARPVAIISAESSGGVFNRFGISKNEADVEGV